MRADARDQWDQQQPSTMLLWTNDSLMKVPGSGLRMTEDRRQGVLDTHWRLQPYPSLDEHFPLGPAAVQGSGIPLGSEALAFVSGTTANQEL